MSTKVEQGRLEPCFEETHCHSLKMSMMPCYDQRSSHTSPWIFSRCVLVLSRLTQTATPWRQVLDERAEGSLKFFSVEFQPFFWSSQFFWSDFKVFQVFLGAMVRITKVLGNGKTPPPPMLGKIPNNPVFCCCWRLHWWVTMMVITHQWHGDHNPVAAVHWALLPDQGDDELDDEHPGKGVVQPGELDEIRNVPVWWCVAGPADIFISTTYFDQKSFYLYQYGYWYIVIGIDKDADFNLGKKHRATNSEVAIVSAVKAARPQLR